MIRQEWGLAAPMRGTGLNRMNVDFVIGGRGRKALAK